MRRCRVLVVVASVAAVWGAGALAGCGAAVRAAGSWGRAIEVPGLETLNKGGDASVISVSCASPGNCAAGGDYRNHGHQGFVAVEKNGRWGRAIEVPGLGALNAGGDAEVFSVSCASAGSCAAGGYYRDQHRKYQGFVVSERNGRWGQAIKVPGLGAPDQGPTGVSSVSCGSAGNCAAGGGGLVVVSERNGHWGRAIEVPGLGALNAGGVASVESVSCASVGSCAAGGYYAGGSYADGAGHAQGFVAVEKNGVWGRAIEVPGLGALNKGGKAGGDAGVLSVSCASAGNCAAGGDYGGNGRGFVVSERNGVWGRAMQVPGLSALGGTAAVSSVSCASAGNCAAGGDYGWPYDWGFVVSEKNGVWGQAINVPGLGALVTGRYADVNSVSCASPGNCAAGGDYEDMAHGSIPGFVVSEKNGVWGRAIKVPGSGVNSVSCAPAGNCVAGGSDGNHSNQGFVTQ